MELEDLDEVKMDAFNKMVAQKMKVARAYNKRMKRKILLCNSPPRTKDRE